MNGKRKGILADLQELVDRAKTEYGYWDFRRSLESLDAAVDAQCEEWIKPDTEFGRSIVLPNTAERPSTLRFVATTLALAKVEALWRPVLTTVQSPLEEQFFFALVIEAWRQSAGVTVIDRHGDGRGLDLSLPSQGLEHVTIEAQPEAADIHPDFRVQFLDYASNGREVAQVRTEAFVEIDGHDFHERTKQQATRDKKRDRALAAQGHTVLRFSGSEVFRSPLGAASETLSHLRWAANRPFWERRLKDGGQEELSDIAKDAARAAWLHRETGLTVDEWAKRLGLEPPPKPH